MMDIWWNPALENQAIDRVHRIGQRKPVEVHRIFVNNTVEDRILELQRKKQVCRMGLELESELCVYLISVHYLGSLRWCIR